MAADSEPPLPPVWWFLMQRWAEQDAEAVRIVDEFCGDRGHDLLMVPALELSSPAPQRTLRDMEGATGGPERDAAAAA